MARLRWWLARRFAPVPITAYPEKGAAIIAVGDRAWITLTFTKARLRSTSILGNGNGPLFAASDALLGYRPARIRYTFVGIADSDGT